MKRLLALLFGLLSSVIISIVVIGIGIATNFDVQSFGIFFIVPIGSIIIGALAATGYAYGIKIFNQKKTSLDYIVSGFLGILAAFIIYFGFYQLTRLTYEGDIIYSFNEGTHISQYADDNDQPFTFSNYMITGINMRQISFSYHGRSVGTTPESPIIGWIDFSIEFIGYLLGSLAGLVIIVSTQYCDTCKLYYKRKKWLEIDRNQSATAVENIEKAIKNKTSIYDSLQGIPASSGEYNVIFEGESCQQCGDGIFRTEINKKDKDGGRKTLDEFTQEIKIKHNVVVEGNLDRKKIIEEIAQKA